MTTKDLAKAARSFRRFDNSYKIEIDELLEIIDIVRYAPSARNGQTLKFMPICDKTQCDQVFKGLKWASYLTEWNGPSLSERPSSYIVILHDTQLGIYNPIDTGLCAELINLYANEKGLGCCMIGAYDHNELEKIINIDNSHFQSVLVIAIGRPSEKVVIDQMKNNDIHYWRDVNEIHHVPKRPLNDIVLKCE